MIVVVGPAPRPVQQEAWRFALIGGLNTVVGVALIILLYRNFGLGLVMSNAAGYGVGLVLSFVLNGAWTFGTTRYSTTMVIKYLALIGLGFVTSMLIIYGLMKFGVAYWLAQLGGVVTYSGIVFLGMKYAVFSR